MSLSGLNGFGRCARFGLQFGLLLWRAVRLPAASTLACPSSVRCLLPSRRWRARRGDDVMPFAIGRS